MRHGYAVAKAVESATETCTKLHLLVLVRVRAPGADYTKKDWVQPQNREPTVMPGTNDGAERLVADRTPLCLAVALMCDIYLLVSHIFKGYPTQFWGSFFSSQAQTERHCELDPDGATDSSTHL